MDFVLEELEDSVVWDEPELQTRADQINRSRNTTCYRVLLSGAEVAFLALDRWGTDFLVLYEFFIPRAFRGQGIGTNLMRKVECVAKEEGFGRLRLMPTPLDSGVKAERLVLWYQKQGYVFDKKVPSEMEKQLQY